MLLWKWSNDTDRSTCVKPTTLLDACSTCVEYAGYPFILNSCWAIAFGKLLGIEYVFCILIFSHWTCGGDHTCSLCHFLVFISLFVSCSSTGSWEWERTGSWPCAARLTCDVISKLATSNFLCSVWNWKVMDLNWRSFEGAVVLFWWLSTPSIVCSIFFFSPVITPFQSFHN